MPLVVLLALAGFVVSAVLGLIIAVGWVSIRARVEAGNRLHWYGADEFGRAWLLSVICGAATTCVGIAIAWKMGVDIGMMIGG